MFPSILMKYDPSGSWSKKHQNCVGQALGSTALTYIEKKTWLCIKPRPTQPCFAKSNSLSFSHKETDQQLLSPQLFTTSCVRGSQGVLVLCFPGGHPAADDCSRPPRCLWLLWTLQPRLWGGRPRPASEPGPQPQWIRESGIPSPSPPVPPLEPHVSRGGLSVHPALSDPKTVQNIN